MGALGALQLGEQKSWSRARTHWSAIRHGLPHFRFAPQRRLFKPMENRVRAKILSSGHFCVWDKLGLVGATTVRCTATCGTAR